MSGKYVFGRGVTIGQVGGTIGPWAVMVVKSSPARTQAQMNKTTLKDGDSLTINDETIEGPCTVEVRDGKVLVDGKERAATPPVAISIVIKSKLDRDLHLGSGRIVVEGDMGTGSIHTEAGSVTVHGDARDVKTGTGDIHVGGTVASAKAGMGDIKVAKIVGNVTYL